jgi:hypothetical protein
MDQCSQKVLILACGTKKKTQCASVTVWVNSVVNPAVNDVAYTLHKTDIFSLLSLQDATCDYWRFEWLVSVLVGGGGGGGKSTCPHVFK